VARDKLGIPAEHVQPTAITRQDRLEYIESLSGRPDGKLIWSRDHADARRRGQTTTTVGLTDGLTHRQEGAVLPARAESRPMLRRQGGGAAATPRSCRWRTSTSISPATFTPSAPQQPARRADRQSRLLGQLARARHAPHQLRRVVDMNDRALRSIVSSLAASPTVFRARML